MQFRRFSAARTWAAIGLAAFVSFASTAVAVDLRVGSGCDFQSIGNALASMASGDHNYRILLKGQTFAENLVTDGLSFTMDGGYANCTDNTKSGSTVITRDHTGDSILEIRGASNVVLSNLIIRSGSITSTNGAGGGINFDGNGSLTLTSVGVTLNTAGYGAGINVDPSGGSATLTLDDNTTISSNTAQYSGGGIRMAGASKLLILKPTVFIFGNQATGSSSEGYGGGIDVVGPAQAVIASTGPGGAGVLVGNSAKYGGGLAVEAVDGNPAGVNMFTLDANLPVRISGNTASVYGGGVYLSPDITSTVSAHATFCASDFRIDTNSAPEGSALVANSDSDNFLGNLNNYVYLNPFNVGGTSPCADVHSLYGAQTCTGKPGCNSIDGNLAQDANGAATHGATIRQFTGATTDDEIQIDKVSMIDNHGGRLLRLAFDASSPNPSRLTNCLLANNVLSDELILTENNTALILRNCTVASNTLGASRVFALSDDFTLNSSIVWEQSGKTVLAHVGGSGSLSVTDVLASETNSLGGANSSFVRSADPRFIDPAHNDFHLQAASPAVDATTILMSNADLDGNPRMVDLAIVPNKYPAKGTNSNGDLGAYERQSVGNLVLNPGFDTDLRLWTDVVPGSDSWQDHTLVFPTPTARLSVSPASNGEHPGLTQCVHVPGPGTYQITGQGEALNFGSDNLAELHWVYIAGTDDSCSGTPTYQGILYFAQTGDLEYPAAPAIVTIPAALWGASSAFKITTYVSTTNASNSAPSQASFDNIDVEPAADEIFGNGFDRIP